MRNHFATITNISYEETGYHRTMITTHAAPNKKYGSCLKNVKHNRRGRPPIDPRIVDFMKKDRLEGSTIQHIAWKYNVSVSTAAKYLKGVPHKNRKRGKITSDAQTGEVLYIDNG